MSIDPYDLGVITLIHKANLKLIIERWTGIEIEHEKYSGQ